MAVSNSFLTGIAERGPEAAPPVEADSPPGSERAAALDASAESPRRVWLFVDLEVFGRACGLFGRDLQSAWARWWVIAEARDGIWGTVDEPTIGLELEVLRQPPCVTGVGECGREASMSVSASLVAGALVVPMLPLLARIGCGSSSTSRCFAAPLDCGGAICRALGVAGGLSLRLVVRFVARSMSRRLAWQSRS